MQDIAKYKTLSFENFLIRMAEEKDAPAVLELVNANRNRITNYFPGIIRFCDSLSDLQRHLEVRSKEANEGKYVIMLIFDSEEKNIMGLVQLKDIDTNAQKREIGAFVDERFQGKRVMIQALRELFTFDFNENNINKIFLRTAETNLSARRLAEKLGFRQEGILREDFKDSEGKYINCVYCGLLRLEWLITASNSQ